MSSPEEACLLQGPTVQSLCGHPPATFPTNTGQTEDTSEIAAHQRWTPGKGFLEEMEAGALALQCREHCTDGGGRGASGHGNSLVSYVTPEAGEAR